jgi:hypothetical protein
MKRYAFLDANGTVLNLIVGNLTADEQQVFLRDHNAMYGAQQIIEVDETLACGLAAPTMRRKDSCHHHQSQRQKSWRVRAR